MPKTKGEISWSDLIAHLIECLSEDSYSLEETCSRYGYLMGTFYPKLRQTVLVRDPGGASSYRLVFQAGFPASDEEIGEMIHENEAYMKPFLMMRKPRFLTCEDYPQEIKRSRFGETCAAHIPICSGEESYGWLTLSSTSPDHCWTSEEMEWLPVTGRLCGAFIRRASKGIGPDAAVSVDQSPLSRLTRREQDVLALIAQAKNNREIAQDLVISESTVRKHVENIYSKLDVNSRSQAIFAARDLLGF